MAADPIPKLYIVRPEVKHGIKQDDFHTLISNNVNFTFDNNLNFDRHVICIMLSVAKNTIWAVRA